METKTKKIADIQLIMIALAQLRKHIEAQCDCVKYLQSTVAISQIDDSGVRARVAGFGVLAKVALDGIIETLEYVEKTPQKFVSKKGE